MDFIFEYWWIFVLPLIPIGIYLLILGERSHTRVMALAAARLNLVFQKKAPGLPFRKFSLLSKSWFGRIRNVSKAEVGGSEMVLLDYKYTEGLGESASSITQTVGAVRVAGLKFPAFLLEAKRASFKGMKFDSHPQFSKKYRLTGADETAIRQLFGSYILEFFQHARGESVECDGEWMIIYNSMVEGDEYRAIVADVTRLADGQADTGVSIHEALMRKYLEETKRILDVFRHST